MDEGGRKYMPRCMKPQRLNKSSLQIDLDGPFIEVYTELIVPEVLRRDVENLVRQIEETNACSQVALDMSVTGTKRGLLRCWVVAGTEPRHLERNRYKVIGIIRLAVLRCKPVQPPTAAEWGEDGETHRISRKSGWYGNPAQARS